MLYGCNSNYLDITNEYNEDESVLNKTENNNQQINIDELLETKEPFMLTNLTPIKKIAILLPMTGRYAKIGKAINDGIEIQLNEFSNGSRPNIRIFDTGDENINIKYVLKK